MKSDKFGTFFYQNLCQVVSLGHKNKLKFLSTFFISLKNFVYKFFYWKKILMKKFEKIFLKNDKKNKKIQKIFRKYFFTKNLNDFAKKTNDFSFLNSDFSHQHSIPTKDRSWKMHCCMLDSEFDLWIFKSVKKKKHWKIFFEQKIHLFVEFIHYFIEFIHKFYEFVNKFFL